MSSRRSKNNSVYSKIKKVLKYRQVIKNIWAIEDGRKSLKMFLIRHSEDSKENDKGQYL